MKNVMFILCALAVFSVGLLSATGAHAYDQVSDKQIVQIADYDDTNDDNSFDLTCDMNCHNHCHNHLVINDIVQIEFSKASDTLFITLSENNLSSPFYGLKRPPRI